MIPNRLRELRKEKKLTIRDFDDLLHVNRNTIHKLETGQQSLSDEYIEMFCKFYNVSADYLLGYSDVRNSKDFNKIHEPLYIKIYDELKELDQDSQDDIFSMISKMKEIIQKK